MNNVDRNFLVSNAFKELGKSNGAIISTLVNRVLEAEERWNALTKLLIEKDIIDENDLDSYLNRENSAEEVGKNIDELWGEIASEIERNK